jgi:hypothetical protein
MRKKANKAQNAVIEIEEAVQEMYECLSRIEQALKPFPSTYERARTYWLAHIDGALENRGGWCGGSFIDLNETLSELMEDI